MDFPNFHPAVLFSDAPARRGRAGLRPELALSPQPNVSRQARTPQKWLQDTGAAFAVIHHELHALRC
jgi:hypothetical protein